MTHGSALDAKVWLYTNILSLTINLYLDLLSYCRNFVQGLSLNDTVLQIKQTCLQTEASIKPWLLQCFNYAIMMCFAKALVIIKPSNKQHLFCRVMSSFPICLKSSDVVGQFGEECVEPCSNIVSARSSLQTNNGKFNTGFGNTGEQLYLGALSI